MNTSGSVSTTPMTRWSNVCTRTGLTSAAASGTGTHHSSFCSTAVISTEPSARTARFSRKYFSGKWATGVRVTAGTGVIGIGDRSSLLVQASGVGRDVVRHQRQRNGGEPAHQRGHVHDALVADQVLRPPEQPQRDHPRRGQRAGELVHDLLAVVVERGRQARDQRRDLFRGQMSLLDADFLVLVVPVRG